MLEFMQEMMHEHNKQNTLFLVLVSPQSFMRSDAKVLEGIHEFYVHEY